LDGAHYKSNALEINTLARNGYWFWANQDYGKSVYIVLFILEENVGDCGRITVAICESADRRKRYDLKRIPRMARIGEAERLGEVGLLWRNEVEGILDKIEINFRFSVGLWRKSRNEFRHVKSETSKYWCRISLDKEDKKNY